MGQSMTVPKSPILETEEVEPMFTVFCCRKCCHNLYVDEKGFPQKLEKIAGKPCPNCGEQDEMLWCLLGRARTFKGAIFREWEEKGNGA